MPFSGSPATSEPRRHGREAVIQAPQRPLRWLLPQLEEGVDRGTVEEPDVDAIAGVGAGRRRLPVLDELSGCTVVAQAGRAGCREVIDRVVRRRARAVGQLDQVEAL